MNKPYWETLNSKLVLNEPHARVRCDRIRLPDGETQLDWYVTEGADSVSVFALTPAREVVLVKIYRHPLGRWVYELPAGGVNPGNTAEATAIAELAEETGWRASTVEEVGRFDFQPANTARLSHIFFADNITPGPRTGTEAAEAGIETVCVSIPRLIEMLQDGEIIGMPTALAIYHVLTTKKLWAAA